MRVHVVSDVHGSVEELARAGDGADVLVCLGDFVLFLDYDDIGGGIFGTLFGGEAAERLVALRTAGRFDEAREWSRGLWDSLDDDPRAEAADLPRIEGPEAEPVDDADRTDRRRRCR